VAADPGNVHAYNNLGFAALQVGRTGLALQYLEAAMELEGVRPYMLNNLGIAYERTGRNTDALSIYARAVDQDPTYVKARSNRDRVRILVDEQIADEVSRILAEQSRKRRGVDDAPQAALDERLVSGDDSALD
jgi:Flp pilus assembly protein TadD